MIFFSLNNSETTFHFCVLGTSHGIVKSINPIFIEQSALRFDKDELQKILDQEYIRLGNVLDKMSLMELVKRSEIELSKNSTFSVLPLRSLDSFKVWFQDV